MIEEAKVAGVYVFGGGIDERLSPVMVTAEGEVSTETYLGSRLTGGFTVLELPTREHALVWARKIAVACRCPRNFARSCLTRSVRLGDRDLGHRSG